MNRRPVPIFMLTTDSEGHFMGVQKGYDPHIGSGWSEKLNLIIFVLLILEGGGVSLYTESRLRTLMVDLKVK